MKKFIAAALCLVMILGLSACAGSSKTDTSAATAAASTAAPAASASASAAAASSAAGKTLIMATNAEFPPYEYYENDKIVGIDAEIAQAVCDKMGCTLEIDNMEFGSIVTAVSSGKADFGMAGMTVTDERKQSVDFSSTYATGVQVVIVKNDSKITSVDDLSADGATYTIGVQQDTTGDIYATDDFGDERVQRFNKGADAVAALSAGKIDCVIIDNEPAKAFVAANTGLKILDTSYVTEDYAACFAKGSTLTAEFNTALEALIKDGTVQSIIDKYISAD